MHLHLFLLLFSSGASSYFLPQKETLRVQNKTQTIIDEMLCLLEAENKTTEMKFNKPVHIKEKNCAHDITQIFICELNKMSKDKCMQKVDADMNALKRNCTILGESSSNNQECSKVNKSTFSGFKDSLKKFLEWVNEKQYCKTLPRGSGLYLGDKCSCRNK